MRRFIPLTLLLTMAVFTGYAQYKAFTPEPPCTPDTLGQAQVWVQYDARFYIDTTHQQKPLQEEMLLEIGTPVSKFHSYAQFLCDSVLADDFARKASQETLNAHLAQYANYNLTESVCKHYPTGRCTLTDCIGGSVRIRCDEQLEMPRWRLTQESDTLLEYACLTAECDFKGRHWKAWYAPEIAISEGPWKLCGLPGLILKAEDSEGHYRFTAKGIRQCRPPRPILLKQAIFDSVSRKRYDKMHQHYWDDPIGFIMGSNPNMAMTVTDEHGNTIRPRSIPHNPIER